MFHFALRLFRYFIIFSSREFANFFFFPFKSLVCLKVNVYGMKLNVTSFYLCYIFTILLLEEYF